MCYKSVDRSRYQQDSVLRKPAAHHPPTILFIGGNMQRKGLPTLIRAAPAVLTAYPESRFLVAGTDRIVPKMKALCRSLKVADHFHFLGWQPASELLNVYAQATLFTMPSLIEAFGMVYIEAMAAGVPVIGTRVGGVPEIIHHNQNGLLVEPDDPVELGQAIIRLLRDEKLTDRFRHNGFETARQFDVSEMVTCTARVYKKVLGTD